MISLRTTCLCVFLLSLFQLNAQAQAQLEGAKLKPYMFFSFSNDSPTDHNYGAFHYTNVHRTLPAEMVGAYYQSGLFHTWYRPVKIYGQKISVATSTAITRWKAEPGTSLISVFVMTNRLLNLPPVLWPAGLDRFPTVQDKAFLRLNAHKILQPSAGKRTSADTVRLN